MKFLYDHTGIFAVKYNNATYFYRKDAQANIVALLDTNGAVVVKYKYNAWGKCQTTVVNSSATEIANLNPFRYRSYYFDTETSLYFLKTRYYDPEIGRFITIDDISYLDPESINGLNLYAYCLNNPVMGYDPNGTLEWYHWLGIIGAVIVVAAATVLTCGAFGIAVGGAGLAGTVIHGAAVGALLGAGIGAVGGAIAGGIYSAVTGADFWSSIGKGALAGFGIGAIIGALVGSSVGYSTTKVHSVYVSKTNGVVNYVGRTNNISRRTAEHALAKRGIVPQEVAKNLTLKQARGLEQALINKYGMLKNGGILINKINSIAPTNPIYNKAVSWGAKYILKFLSFLP